MATGKVDIFCRHRQWQSAADGGIIVKINACRHYHAATRQIQIQRLADVGQSSFGSVSLPAIPAAAAPQATKVAASPARAIIKRKSGFTVGKINFRVSSAESLGAKPSWAKSGMLSCQIRPLEIANVNIYEII